MKELTDEQFKELQYQSQMLGRIGSYVEGFCEDEEDTTEVAVLRLLSEYHFLKSDEIHSLIAKAQTLH